MTVLFFTVRTVADNTVAFRCLVDGVATRAQGLNFGLLAVTHMSSLE